MGEETANVTLLLYEDLQNSTQVQELLTSGRLQAAVVNASMLYHCDQLLLAAHKSFYNARNGQLKTRSVFTELLYSLFPSRSIRDALSMLGLQKECSSALFVLLDDHSGSFRAEVEGVVLGQPISLDNIARLRNTEAIRKLYKVPENVTDENDVLNVILTRMATKEFLL